MIWLLLNGFRHDGQFGTWFWLLLLFELGLFWFQINVIFTISKCLSTLHYADPIEAGNSASQRESGVTTVIGTMQCFLSR